MEYTIYMKNTKERKNINEILKSRIGYAPYNYTILVANRISDRGKREVINLIGAEHCYKDLFNQKVRYMSTTASGYGGKGELYIMNIVEIDSTGSIVSCMNSEELKRDAKLSTWVLV